MHGGVLAALAVQEAIAQAVDRVRAPQVTGGHHPAERGAEGGAYHAERFDGAQQVPYGQLGRMCAQQQAEDDRPGGQRAQVHLAGPF